MGKEVLEKLFIALLLRLLLLLKSGWVFQGMGY